MTEFEKSIKRNVTIDLFKKLCEEDDPYSDNENFYRYTYGNVASWVTWNRDVSGKLSGHESGGDWVDSPLDWDKDAELPLEHRFSGRLTTDVVFVGLNMSGDGGADGSAKKYPPFCNARGHKNIFNVFWNTAAEGGYFTDIIKPDKRILDELKQRGANPANSVVVKRILEAQPDILKDHLTIFAKEMIAIGYEKPLLIAYGGTVNWILERGFEYGILSRFRFHGPVEIYHYSYNRNEGVTIEGHRTKARERLAGYLTIPDVVQHDGAAWQSAKKMPEKKDGKTPPDSGSSERNDSLLKELIGNYNSNLEGEFPEAGKIHWNGTIPYCHINVPDWPEEVFYEFVDRRNGANAGNVELRLHIETVDYPNLKGHISTYQSKMIGEYRVEYQPAKGGRLVILLPYSAGYDTMIDCMHKLISLTKDAVTDFIKNQMS